jgi:neutral ceramidase
MGRRIPGLWIPILCGIGIAACADKNDKAVTREPVYIHAGSPMAGVAETFIDFPMGAPLGGYSARCNYLGWAGKVDKRQSAYTVAFSQSVGVQTRARTQALWLTNGDQDLIILKADVIYAFDGLVRAVEQRLTEVTGRNLEGRVVVTTSHTHHAPANFSDSYHFYLGGDRYNEEVFQRFATSLTDTALAAWGDMHAAAIGIGMSTDWDPDNLVYSDRRDVNDALQVWEDRPPGEQKDPNLWVLRVDTQDGDPLGVFFNFGMHGTSLGGDNTMVSTDSTGHVEYALAERFDSPIVVAHWQGSGGDASPRGQDEGYARLESIGELAADAIYDLWAETPVSSQPLFIETVTHSVQTQRDQIAVTRNGAVDWRYRAFEDGYVPDDQIYDDEGEIISPLDEFNAQYGGAFCGSDEPLISTGTIGANVYPYDGCMDLELITLVLNGLFQIEYGEIPLPLPSSLMALTSATRLGPIDMRLPDGSVVTDDAYIGFFPGETTEMYTAQFKRRAREELGLEHVLVVGYAQDHEGYLLIPEDWLVGGYEPNINVWGPLQAEHIMEGTLDMMRSHLLTNRLEPIDPRGEFPDTIYPVRDLPETIIDTTPTAGTVPSAVIEELYVPLEGITVATQPTGTVARVQGLAQFMWMGGDPAVDLPTVTLQRWEDEAWTPVMTEAGRTITDGLPDIITATTPDPMYPFEGVQEHHWWAGFQAVSHHFDRTALPLGWYRLQVTGDVASGEGGVWPWPSTPYVLSSDPFQVVPAAITVEVVEGALRAWIAGPAWGYRLIDMGGISRGANPVRDATITWRLGDWSTIQEVASADIIDGVGVFPVDAPAGAIGVTVEDIHGNLGAHYFDIE